MSTTLSVWALLTLSTQQSQHLARTDAQDCAAWLSRDEGRTENLIGNTSLSLPSFPLGETNSSIVP